MTAGVDTSVWPPRYDPAYRPDPTADCWFPELECLSPETREALILDKLRRQVAWAWERSPFYRRKWDAAGVSPATLRSLEDLAKFPVVQKVELRLSQAAAPPYGEYLCIEPGEVARIHGTSGTTGRPRMRSTSRRRRGARGSTRGPSAFAPSSSRASRARASPRRSD